MAHKLIVATLALLSLAGCVVIPEHPQPHHVWHDRQWHGADWHHQEWHRDRWRW